MEWVTQRSRRRAGVLRGVYYGAGATKATVYDMTMKRGTRGRKELQRCTTAKAPNAAGTLGSVRSEMLRREFQCEDLLVILLHKYEAGDGVQDILRPALVDPHPPGFLPVSLVHFE